jgi:hypothetical protein
LRHNYILAQTSPPITQTVGGRILDIVYINSQRAPSP